MSRLKKIACCAVLFFTVSCNQLYAEPVTQNSSFGFTGFYGYSDMHSKDTAGVDPGFCAGGGLVFEKMFSDRFGFRSGIEYGYSRIDFVMSGAYASSFDATWSFQKILVPLQLITSFNAGSFSVNLLTGINYGYIFISEMSTDTAVIIDTHNDDAKKYINSNQFALSAGILLRFRFTRFTDFFMGAEGDYFLTNLLNHDSGADGTINVMEARFTAGWMFRTGIFPSEAGD